MAHPQLHHADVDAMFDQVGGPGVAERVDGGLLGHAGGRQRFMEGFLKTAFVHGRSGVALTLRRSAGKQPDGIAVQAPLRAQHAERARGQRNRAVLITFAAANEQVHTRAVDLGDLQVDAFEQTQTAGGNDAQTNAVVGATNLGDDAPDLFGREHDGQFLGQGWADEVVQGPGTA
jgi:hypothetical protein